MLREFHDDRYGSFVYLASDWECCSSHCYIWGSVR